jgi:hypothetical protein
LRRDDGLGKKDREEPDPGYVLEVHMKTLHWEIRKVEYGR